MRKHPYRLIMNCELHKTPLNTKTYLQSLRFAFVLIFLLDKIDDSDVMSAESEQVLIMVIDALGILVPRREVAEGLLDAADQPSGRGVDPPDYTPVAPAGEPL